MADQTPPDWICSSEGRSFRAQLDTCRTIEPSDDVAQTILSHATSRCVVAVDAPLIITNEFGQRLCETEVGRRYGSREGSCHTTNLTRFKDSSSVAITAMLAGEGFVHADLRDANTSGRIVMEVYPHAAMVALWNLPKTIKYKKGSSHSIRVGLRHLRDHLRELVHGNPQLRRNELLVELLGQELMELRGQQLKSYQDQLDALFCAYLAFYYWHWGKDGCEIFGDCERGYILNPQLCNRARTKCCG